MIIVSETIENYIYCRVIFEENGKSYYYLTDDEEIKPLDLVVVPVGIDGHEKIAQVIKVEKYTIHTVPYPLDKIKKIIRKCKLTDFRKLENKLAEDKLKRESIDDEELSIDLLNLGVQAYRRGDYEIAKEYYEDAAQLGNSQAACNLGYIYAYGRTGVKDSERAFYYFVQASLDGNSNGSYKVGDVYFYGDFVEKNKLLAFKYYQISEEQLGPEDLDIRSDVYYRLALCYHQGAGVVPDDMGALTYINLAQTSAYYDRLIGKYNYEELKRKIENLREKILLNLNHVDNKTKIRLLKVDITKVDNVDAIVNAANTSLLGGGGVDGAIHRVAGPLLLKECRQLNGCEVGQAKITSGYNLPVEYVIHTVGPIWKGGNADESQLLAACYRNSLRLAQKCNIRKIAFPAISTGIYGYPVVEATKIAFQVVKEYVQDNPGDFDLVEFVLFDDSTYNVYLKETGSNLIEL